jgi:hypothetical protein
MTAARAAVLSLLLLLPWGCAGTAGPERSANRAVDAATTLFDGDLTEYVSAAGLRWMVVGDPKRLSSDAALADAIGVFFPPNRLDAFAQSTGVDLRLAPRALAAGFDYSTLYMVATPHENAAVEERFVARLTNAPMIRSPHPRLSRSTGVVGSTPQTLIRVDQGLVAVAVGDPTPARVVEAYARRKLERSPCALRGVALRSLPNLERYPLRFYAPGPFEGRWTQGIGGLLLHSTALAAAAEPRTPDLVGVRLVLTGEVAELPDAEARLEKAWNELSESSLGRLLGLADAGIEVNRREARLELTAELRVSTLVRGLHAAVRANVRELMDEVTPSFRPEAPASWKKPQ